jgi:peroxiredoxin Q/BCP
MMKVAFSVLFGALTLVACTKGSAPTPPPSASTSTQPAASATTTTTTGAAAGELAVGKPAPDFSAKAHDGTEIKLSALKGKPVVVYFYPKDETPGCTKEACAFRDAWKDLAKTNVVLVGVSTDTEESHKAFAKHHDLPFHLVSDRDGSIAKQFGVPNRGGYLGRQTFVIGRDGNVKKVYREVDVSKHASEVLADLEP